MDITITEYTANKIISELEDYLLEIGVDIHDPKHFNKESVMIIGLLKEKIHNAKKAQAKGGVE